MIFSSITWDCSTLIYPNILLTIVSLAFVQKYEAKIRKLIKKERKRLRYKKNSQFMFENYDSKEKRKKKIRNKLYE